MTSQEKSARVAIRRKSIVPKGVRTLHDMYPVGMDGQTYCYAVSESRADYIVRACNSFDGMLDALKKAQALLDIATVGEQLECQQSEVLIDLKLAIAKAEKP